MKITHHHHHHLDPAIERVLEKGFFYLRAITTQLEALMTKFSEYAAVQKAYNEQMSASIDGIKGDIDSLNEKITALQNSSGQVTPEDQALIDDLVTAGAALKDRVKEVDDLTPPVVPPAPPAE